MRDCLPSGMSCVALPCLAGSADADFSYRLSPSARLAVVVNPQSGDRSGQHWLDWFAATHPQVRRVDLTKSDADILDGEPELPPLDRVIIAGGDGVSAAFGPSITPTEQPPISKTLPVSAAGRSSMVDIPGSPRLLRLPPGSHCVFPVPGATFVRHRRSCGP